MGKRIKEIKNLYDLVPILEELVKSGESIIKLKWISNIIVDGENYEFTIYATVGYPDNKKTCVNVYAKNGYCVVSDFCDTPLNTIASLAENLFFELKELKRI